MELFEGATAKSLKAGQAEELAALPLDERLKRRIIDGEKNGLEADLEAALAERPALDIVNETLLDGMKVVGELFGSGQMQLPFVLQSAEVMKGAVAYLEPHMEKSDDEGKGTIVLATVRGDVHDIGKNLVDIILSNNGYNVVNLGIKQPVSAILEAAEEHKADVIGMSGLLVKSTVIMKENLQELNQRKMAADYPVILGGAALTRAYVEQDLHEIYEGEVRYARDAFEGLRLMDALIAVKRGVPGATLPELKQRRVAKRDVQVSEPEPEQGAIRSDVAVDNAVPTPPFWGTRVIKGIQLKEYASWLDEGALFKGQWGLRPARTGGGPTYEELVETEGRPRLRGWLGFLHTRNLLEAAAVHGYFPCTSKGDDLIILGGRHRADAVHLPAAAARSAPVPGRLLPPRGLRRDRRGRPPGRHRRFADRRGHRRAVRGQLLPRLPRTARPVRAVGGGAGRVLARPVRGELGFGGETRPTSRTCSR
ncbi:methionine synthase [Streptomyces noursei]|uniref:Methionine synthase n=1 Tax=Streptomyces noursei TaxID=1971 RepID=A0A401RDQ3_STRNR|nr:methionine synthase [Streptomyces noursei]